MNKKILEIKKGEYLLDVLNSGAINTTYNIDVALDIRNWKLEDVGYIVENLKKVGYTKAQILTVADKDNQEASSVLGKNTFETSNKISKAMMELESVKNEA